MDPKAVRRVSVGDEITIALPKTEVCEHLQVASEVRPIRVLDGRVQILPGIEGDRPVIYQPSHADAGVFADDEGLYVLPVPAEQWQIFRHGQPVSARMVSDLATGRWLLKNQGHSPDYAVKHGGYEVRHFAE